MALLDWWRMGQQDPGSVYNIAPGGTFTTMFGNPQPDPPGTPPLPTFAAGQPFAPAFAPFAQTPEKPPENTPGNPKIPEVVTPTPGTDERRVAPNTPKIPELLTGPRDERTVPPPIVPDPPPASRKVPEVLTPIAGPDNKPARDERLVPTPASQTPAAAAGNDWDRIMKMMKDPKMGPAIAALSKLGGSGKGPAPPAPWRSTMHPGNPGFNAGNPGSASQILQGMTGGAQRREEARLKKMAQRRNERDRYDILAGRG